MQNRTVYHPFKPVTLSINNVEKMTFLIAVSTKNSENKEGFVVYQTNELGNWDRRDTRPLIDSILFKTTEQAFKAGEEILRNSMVNKN